MEKFIKQFVSEKLGGNIDGLLNYDLSQLRGDDMYGCDNREFDCDDTNIARAIYSVVFKDVEMGQNCLIHFCLELNLKLKS